MTPRLRCPRRLRVFSASGSSERQASQISSGISAKKERKKTSYPVGYRVDMCLMAADISVKATAESSFRLMPRRGDKGPQRWEEQMAARREGLF